MLVLGRHSSGGPGTRYMCRAPRPVKPRSTKTCGRDFKEFGSWKSCKGKYHIHLIHCKLLNQNRLDVLVGYYRPIYPVSKIFVHDIYLIFYI
jgi:hypothetical protein